MFDSAADVRLQDMFPLYWHSEKSEYTWGWQAQDAYDMLALWSRAWSWHCGTLFLFLSPQPQ